MFKLARTGRILFAVCIVAALAVGMTATFTEVQAAKGGACHCPMIYAPVVCKGGKVFPNQCVADCRHAKDCVPLGAI